MIKNCIWNNYFLLNVHRFHRQQDKCIVLDTQSLILKLKLCCVQQMCHSSIAPVTASCHVNVFVTMQLTYYRLNETLKLIFTKIILAYSKVHKFKSLGKNSANLEKNRLFFSHYYITFIKILPHFLHNYSVHCSIAYC